MAGGGWPELVGQRVVGVRIFVWLMTAWGGGWKRAVGQLIGEGRLISDLEDSKVVPHGVIAQKRSMTRSVISARA